VATSYLKVQALLVGATSAIFCIRKPSENGHSQ